MISFFLLRADLILQHHVIFIYFSLQFTIHFLMSIRFVDDNTTIKSSHGSVRLNKCEDVTPQISFFFSNVN
jgi:hypothetical protein